MNGLGLLIFPSGSYIYGNFLDNNIYDIALLYLTSRRFCIGYWK